MRAHLTVLASDTLRGREGSMSRGRRGLSPLHKLGPRGVVRRLDQEYTSEAKLKRIRQAWIVPDRDSTSR